VTAGVLGDLAMIDFAPVLRSYPYQVDAHGNLLMEVGLHNAPMGWPQMKVVARWY
jgi:hypothetical protein